MKYLEFEKNRSNKFEKMKCFQLNDLPELISLMEKKTKLSLLDVNVTQHKLPLNSAFPFEINHTKNILSKLDKSKETSTEMR